MRQSKEENNEICIWYIWTFKILRSMGNWWNLGILEWQCVLTKALRGLVSAFWWIIIPPNWKKGVKGFFSCHMEGKMTMFVLFSGRVCGWPYVLEYPSIFCNCWYENVHCSVFLTALCNLNLYIWMDLISLLQVEDHSVMVKKFTSVKPIRWAISGKFMIFTCNMCTKLL